MAGRTSRAMGPVLDRITRMAKRRGADTPAEFSRRTGLAESHARAILSRKYPNFSIKTLVMILWGLECEFEDLVPLEQVRELIEDELGVPMKKRKRGAKKS